MTQSKRGTWLYGAAGLIALVEGAILVAALNPDVDAAYRGYFIDRTTDCYPLPVSGAYTLGDRVSFGPSPNNAKRAAVARCGWRNPDPQGGSWSDGDRSMLRFAVGARQMGLVLELSVQPYIDEQAPTQRVKISANGRLVQTLELAERKRTTLQIDIPAEVIGAEGLLDVTLAYPDARSLAGAPGTGKRSYAIFLYDLMLMPAGEKPIAPAAPASD